MSFRQKLLSYHFDLQHPNLAFLKISRGLLLKAGHLKAYFNDLDLSFEFRYDCSQDQNGEVPFQDQPSYISAS